MAYSWTNTIVAGNDATAAAANEIKTNIDTELTARDQSQSWTYLPVLSGNDIRAVDINELREAADLAYDNNSCVADHGTTDNTADGTNNTGVDSGHDTSVDAIDDSSIDSGDDVTVDTGDDIGVNASAETTVNAENHGGN